jgi:hypothetical protein
MGSPYVFVLDGYTFPRDDIPAHGPLVEFSLGQWSRHNVLGAADPGTILTLIGTRSQEWDFVSRASEATKDKLVAVNDGQVKVNFKTPQNPTTGFNVAMTRLLIQHIAPIENSRYLCEFTLVKR